MMQQSKVLETWVGLFVALGLVALFFMAMQVSNLSDIKTNEKSFRITARFANAGSLKVRAPVSMAGVRLGRVEAIHFDKDSYEAVVDMRIDSGYDTLPTDTTASILTQGLLGEQYVGLSPGGADDYLKDGDEVELTQSAMVLEEVISRFLFNKAESGGSKESQEAETEVDEHKVSEPSPQPEPATVTEKDDSVAEEAKTPTPSFQPVPEAVSDDGGAAPREKQAPASVSTDVEVEPQEAKTPAPSTKPRQELKSHSPAKSSDAKAGTAPRHPSPSPVPVKKSPSK